MIRYLMVLIIVSFCSSLSAQHNRVASIKSEFIRSLRKTDIEFDDYHGLLDGVHKVSLYIGRSEDKYVAKAIFPNNEYVHFGPDIIDGDTFTMRDIDSDGVFSGEFVLKDYGEFLKGFWNDDMHIPLYDVVLYKNLPDISCDDFYFYRKLNGSVVFDGNEIEILREGDQVLFRMGGKKFETECTTELCETFAIRGLSTSHIPIPYISMIDNKAYVHNGPNLDLSKPLKVISFYNKECEEEISNGRKYSFEYYETGHEDFNKFLRQKMKIRSRGLEELINGEDNYHRFESVLTLWVEFTYFDDAFASGLIYLQNNYSSRVLTIPFIYDLKANKEVEQSSVFTEELHEITGSSNFNKVLLSEKGFLFKDNFDPIYGQKTKLIKFKDLESKLKYSKFNKIF